MLAPPGAAWDASPPRAVAARDATWFQTVNNVGGISVRRIG
jgi:hypothetical protein